MKLSILAAALMAVSAPASAQAQSTASALAGSMSPGPEGVGHLLWATPIKGAAPEMAGLIEFADTLPLMLLKEYGGTNADAKACKSDAAFMDITQIDEIYRFSCDAVEPGFFVQRRKNGELVTSFTLEEPCQIMADADDRLECVEVMW